VKLLFLPRESSRVPSEYATLDKGYTSISNSLTQLQANQQTVACRMHCQKPGSDTFQQSLQDIAAEIDKIQTALKQHIQNVPYVQEKATLSELMQKHTSCTIILEHIRRRNIQLLSVCPTARYVAEKMQNCAEILKLLESDSDKCCKVNTLCKEFFHFYSVQDTDDARRFCRDTLTCFLLYAKPEGDTTHDNSLKQIIGEQVSEVQKRDLNGPVETYKRCFPGADTPRELQFKPYDWLASSHNYPAIHPVIEKVKDIAQGLAYMSRDILQRIQDLAEQNFTPKRACSTLDDECSFYEETLDDLKIELTRKKNEFLTLAYTDHVIDALQYLAHLRMHLEGVRQSVNLFKEVSQSKAQSLAPIVQSLLPLFKSLFQKETHDMFMLDALKKCFGPLFDLADISIQNDPAFSCTYSKTLYNTLYTIAIQLKDMLKVCPQDAIEMNRAIFQKEKTLLTNGEFSLKLMIYVVKHCIHTLFFSSDGPDPEFDVALAALMFEPPFKEVYLKTVQSDGIFARIMNAYSTAFKHAEDSTELRLLVQLRHCLEMLTRANPDTEAKTHADMYWYAKARKKCHDVQQCTSTSKRIQALMTAADTALYKIPNR
jgi:hypothetical protein